MDNASRNLIQQATQAARRLLEEEYLRQLEGKYDIHPDGTIAPKPGKHLDDREKIARGKIVFAIQHITAGGATPSEAVYGFLRESTFTFLNRFVALKMMEARGLIQECISRGEESVGYKEFLFLAPGLSVLADQAYRMYIESLFDEIGLEVRVLFDKCDPASLLWPRRPVLIEYLGILNAKEMKDFWAEDETIGWVYQYFNSQDERREMRVSQAPRNSRELAVRNQFFTPRFVVEFLTENTLGRIWYEMRRGETALKEECRFLVRRPNEVFLAQGEKAPVAEENEAGLPLEDLLKKPIHIVHRPKKDPRDLRVLDPACGSGHFLLYAFDLLERIYEEAWEGPEGLKSEVTGRTLREEYETLDDLRLDAPRLIVEHNLHGIDIDPRAVQIAALAVWLRAQKTWKNLGINAVARPRIAKSNIVTAEPMPGEKDMRQEFIDGLKPRVLGQLVDVVFDKMKLAGEAGSLLKIEEEIKDTVAEAHKQWMEGPKSEQQLLFPAVKLPLSVQQELRFDVKGVTDGFWEQAEDRILDALKDYEERAENGHAIRRRLFAEDAARGFTFIDLCRKRYDVVLMNPPFGSFPVSADGILNDGYPTCRGDFYPAFIERWNARSDFLGAITNRTGLSLKGLEEWRQINLLGERSLLLLADLGMNVLDALVEAAIYVIGPSTCESLVAIDCLDIRAETMATRIAEGVAGIANSHRSKFVYVIKKSVFARLPTAPICYRSPNSVIRAFDQFQSSERNGLIFRVTSPNYDDFRYLRLKWEVASSEIGRALRWSPIAKGGEYAPYYADLDLLIDWDEKVESFRGFLGTVHRPLTRPACADLFFKGGLTWSERTASRFSPRVLPEGAIFSSVGPYCGGLDRGGMLFVLGVIMSAPYQAILEMFLAAGDATSSGSAARHYQVGALRSIPFPDFPEGESKQIREGVRELTVQFQKSASSEETNSLFVCSSSILPDTLLADAVNQIASARRNEIRNALTISKQIDELVANRYGFDPDGMTYVASIFGLHPFNYPESTGVPRGVHEIIERDEDEIIRGAVQSGKTGRYITVKSYYADRKLEVLSHIAELSGLSILPLYEEICLRSEAISECTESLLSYVIGCAFGRWDIRVVLDSSLGPKLPDPFNPLPVCPPGMLVGPDGLPADTSRIVSEEWLRSRPDVNTLPPEGSVKNPTIKDSDYPLRINWDGIFVDDSGFNEIQPHRDDIVRRVREVLDLVWKGKSHEIEQEVCDILGISGLRDYFRGPNQFFHEHLKRYSKSRRKAPIYWRLSTSSGNYSVWLYYHRFTKDTLYKVLNEYINPKIEYEERGLTSVRQEAGPMPSANQRKEIEARTGFLEELRAFRDEIARIAPLWNPDLNDGVIINSAPLWRLVPHQRTWQKDIKECWESLVAGEYDWSHLAMHYWPERVVQKCTDDLSLAIAHGLENVFWEKDAKEKWKKRKVLADDVKHLVVERTSSSVTAALNDLLSAAGSVENGKRTRKPSAKSTSKGKA